MFDKKLILKCVVFAVIFYILESSSFIFGICAAYYFTGGKIVISAFLGGFIWKFIGYKILTEKIDAKNKAVFITGCDSGIGYYLAKRLDSKGYDVFAGCLSPSTGGALELTKTCSKRLRTFQLNITQNDSILKAKDFIRNNLGKSELWAVVNNAGIYRGFTVELCTLDHFQDIFDVNVMGTVRVTKAFLPMLRCSKGRLININSMAGRYSVPYMTAYSMTKHATIVFTECLQHELLRSGVKVISIEPEFFQTSILSDELIQNLMKESVDNLDDDLKNVYHKKSIKQMHDTHNLFFEKSSPNIDIVIDTLERAISDMHPDTVYMPCRNWIVKLILYTGCFMPSTVIHGIQQLSWKQLGKFAASRQHKSK